MDFYELLNIMLPKLHKNFKILLKFPNKKLLSDQIVIKNV